MTRLDEAIERASYEKLSESAPDLLKEIKASLKAGVTAKQLEKKLNRIYKGSATANLAIGAAYFIEREGIQ